jgi:protein-disulfide isomerase
MGDQLRFVWRQFPLTEVHPHAEQAAEASEAAAAQGKFWPMHDLLFEHQDALDFDSLVRFAGQLGLDVNRFQNDLETQRYADRVQEQFMSGVRSGVAGTPTFFINGEKYEGAPDVQDMLATLQQSVEAG